MSDSSQRQFSCQHCGGMIAIPADLPPTSAPCPMCGQEVTSPALGSQAVDDLSARSQDERQPTVIEPEAVREEDWRAGQEAPEKKSRAGVILGVAILLAALGMAAGLYFLSQKWSPSGAVERTGKSWSGSDTYFLDEGWKEAAGATLKGFLEAGTPEERARYVIGGQERVEDLRRYYSNPENSEAGLELKEFKPMTLIQADRERGIFAMRRNRPQQWEIGTFFQPIWPLGARTDSSLRNLNMETKAIASQFLDEDEQTLVYLKKEDGEMRLDWDTYIQSRDRSLAKFLDSPTPGESAVFRGAIQEDVATVSDKFPAGTRVYRFSDPVYSDNSARVPVDVNSEVGRILEPLAWVGKPGVNPELKSVTLELGWTEGAEPRVEIKKIICWEYLGVGGQPGNLDEGSGK